MKTLFFIIILLMPLLAYPHSLADTLAFVEDFGDRVGVDSELPVVISASRLNQSVLNSPSSVTVIDKAMIAAAGVVEFVDVLRLVPGFQVSPINGRRYAAVYHGYGSEISNRLQVLVNGRSTYTPSLSTVEWDLLGVRLEDIERIEVVRGTSASAYGSNSFTAAINIITKLPELDDDLYLHQRSGSAGENDQLLRYADTAGHFYYRLTANMRSHDGFDDAKDFRDLHSVFFHGRLDSKQRSPMDIYLTYIDGVTGTDDEQSVLKTRDRKVKSWSAHIKGKKIFSVARDLKWNFYHNSDRVDDLTETSLSWAEILSALSGTTVSAATFEALTGAQDQTTVESSETNDSSKTDLEIEYSVSSAQDLRYMLGAGVRHDTLKSLSYFPDKGRVSDISYRMFANAELALGDSMTFNPGAIYEYTANYGGKLSYRSGVNIKLRHDQTLRFSASRAYRFPSLLEKNFDTKSVLDNGFVINQRFLADEYIHPEKIDSYEIGYLGKLSYRPLTWDIKLYHEEITDMVDFPRDSSIIDFVSNVPRVVTNGTEYKVYGVEGELTYRPARETFFKFLFNRGNNKTTILKKINPQEREQIADLMPRKTWGFLASLPVNQWQFSLGWYRYGEMEWLSNGDLIDGYARVDGAIARKFSIAGDKRLSVKLTGQNITGDSKQFDKERVSEPTYQLTFSLTRI
ncbi:MAG: TonB-dependent receptor [Cellvibrionaceae bacterium]|nr:TonB-dependent receptor [Cellvibrionaceae bacterium]